MDLYIGSVLRRSAGPLLYVQRDLWERESSLFEERHRSTALFGHQYEVAKGAVRFRYEPYLIPADTAEDFYSGLNFVWGNRLGLDWALGGGARLKVRERAYLYSHRQPGTAWMDGYYANPFFESRLTATVEFPLGGGGVVARLPVHMQQRLYADCQGAYYSGKLRNWMSVNTALENV